MDKFLYNLPLVLIWASILGSTLTFITNGKKKNILGINVPKIKFLFLAIPSAIVFFGCYLVVDDFKAPYIPWILYCIHLFIAFFVGDYLRKISDVAMKEKAEEYKDVIFNKLDEFKKTRAKRKDDDQEK